MSTGFGYVGKSAVSELGGLTTRIKATAAVLYGDSVFSSASGEVNKSVTAGDRLKRVGIVVDSSFSSASRAAIDVTNGVQAADAGAYCDVCYSGVAWGITGATPLTAGMQVMFSAATAGRLIPATPTTDAGKIVGVVLEDQATAGAAVKILVDLA